MADPRLTLSAAKASFQPELALTNGGGAGTFLHLPSYLGQQIIKGVFLKTSVHEIVKRHQFFSTSPSNLDIVKDMPFSVQNGAADECISAEAIDAHQPLVEHQPIHSRLGRRRPFEDAR